jgi:primary-amine oxidase
MVDTHARAGLGLTSTPSHHPLDPLTAEELGAAVAIVREKRQLSAHVRFVSVTLHEPPRDLVFNFKAGDRVPREAFVRLLDKADGATYEAIVDLTADEVTSWRHVPGVQPSVLLDEFFECEQMLKHNEEFRAALAKRGVSDMDMVMVDPWSAGYYGPEEEPTRRLVRALIWVRFGASNDNGYAHPIEGLRVLVDLNRLEIVKMEDDGVIPVPTEPGNYTSAAVGKLREDIKPLEITQPEGPSFMVQGHEIAWQKWRLRIGFTPREGLVLHTVTYEDQGRLRPILYRAALAEMVVPYADPAPNQWRKNAFDVGEYGVGMLANSLELGCDCLGSIHYFDVHMVDSRGNVVRMPNTICLHEEDYSLLWKHIDWRTNETEVRRSRRLVISFISTVGNYEYGFYWYFYQDGTIQYEVKSTGIMSTGAVAPGVVPRYGKLVAPGLNAPNHQHIFNIRLDPMVDGFDNSVYEVHTEAEPLGPDNPQGNAFFAKATLLERESEAQQHIDPLAARYWKIVNPSVKNWLGEPVGYKLLPGENTLPFAHPTSSVMQRAGFAQKHLWVTPFAPDENFPAGDYPNQHCGGDGLPAWTQKNRDIANRNVVVWYTMIFHHISRTEDWPVMPVSTIGFTLKPTDFFDRNPALDVPPPVAHGDHCAHEQ